MYYYYNEAENSFAIATNFIPDKTPDGYVEISEERYDELQEELNQESQNENEENEIPKVEYNENI